MVADATVDFMRFLIKHGMNIEQVSLAADSLAAHLAALVGQSFEGKIEAIYGKNMLTIFLYNIFFSVKPKKYRMNLFVSI